ncbi:serine/threonine protein phosphatase [Serinicoccus hydrothermalis]|uniref:Serine/threonine protein phosphatase n=1 Tax=Serinicoccus hydrothermalis TaxID=1758689 RepID=A0A1B1NBJ7_9MICO|nr:polynucleotide kinase-phosphatase [Serinicoccus hydrothermalis]ANS78819.1 serine/threonine protein phosphatase [Serinicoccus hydrothermalis]
MSARTELAIPELSLVVLVGASGSGKTTFARRAFGPFETVSSDVCRALVSGDENDQSASADAFDLLHHLVGLRLRRGLLTVVDATNVTRAARADLVRLAREHDVLPVAIVLDVGADIAIERNRGRPERDFGEGPVRRHDRQLRKSLRGLSREGFRGVHVLRSPEEVDAAVVAREPLRSDFRDRTGPFDIVGDVHGCLEELVELLGVLGYAVSRDEHGAPVDAEHPDGRVLVFVGDLVDRGPDSVGVLRLAMGMAEAGHAMAVPGNHEAKLVRALDGAKVTVSHGLEVTLAELGRESEGFRRRVRDWCDGLVAHRVLDRGRLVVAHAGLKEAYHGRASGRVRAFALYGDTTGETDEFGLPVRYPWAEDYRGRAAVVYGHTPTPRLEWINNTLCLDTGAVFGGQLSALRWPERETVQVSARAVHHEPARPFATEATGRGEDELRLTDVTGRRHVETEQLGRVLVTEESAAGALEVMSRFALHPRQVPYLPPTMAPVGSSRRPGFLEHPDEAFAQYAAWGVEEVVCQEKHMGSRAVVHLAPDGGAVYTRTGRAFFEPHLQQELLSRLGAAWVASGLAADLGGDDVLLDAELLPWSAKAEGLVREQYAAVGAAARLALPAAVDTLATAAGRGLDVGELLTRTRERAANAGAFDAAWQRYVWPTEGLDGVQLAPFQVLAAGGQVRAGEDHLWHLGVADRLVEADPGLVRPTRRLVVDTASPDSCAAGVRWWEELAASGGEGMVVKPAQGVARARGKLVQPGLKVRGRDYLRLVYGPDYTLPEHLERLRERHLGHKRALALREHALGLESLARWAREEPLWRVHEAVFAILALESEPVDPRL